MATIVKIIWVMALLLVAGFGVTLSWVMLALSGACIAVAGILGGVCGFYSRRVWTVPGILLFVASIYFLWRALGSPVWDLAKEDALLLGVGVVVYLSGRCGRLSGAWILALCITSALNVLYFGLQKLGIDLLLPMDLVSEEAAATPDFGLFQDYGALGNAMAVSGWVLLCFASWARDKAGPLRLVATLIGASALVVAMSCGSRSAILSIVVAGFLYCVVSWVYSERFLYAVRQKMRGGLIGLAAVAFIGLGILGYLTVMERSPDGEGIPETNVRLAYWGMAIEQGMGSPVIGTGSRSYSYECFRNWSSNLKTIEANPEFVHNEYLQTFADYGLVGFALLLLVLLSHWCVGLYRLCQNEVTEERHWITVAGVVGLTVVMVHGLTDFPQRLPWNLCLATMCLAWCYPKVAKANGKEKTSIFAGKVSLVGTVVFQVLVCMAVGAYAAKEVWAGQPLIESKQVKENGSWEIENRLYLLAPLQEANKRSPDFRRFQHMAQLYHSNAETEGYIDLAIENYRESLKRHPYNIVASIGLAQLYMGKQEFEEADKVYSSVEKYASARDWWFEFYLVWASNESMRASKAAADGEWSAADGHLERAIKLLQKASSRSAPIQKFMRDIYAGRISLAVKRAEYEKAHLLWGEVNETVPLFVIHTKGSGIQRMLGDSYLSAAAKEWTKRKPALAKELFLKARFFYLQDRQISGNKESWRLERLQYIEEQLKLLKTAGY